MKNNILKTVSIIITFCFFFFNTNTSFATEIRTLSFTEQPATNYDIPWYESGLVLQYTYGSSVTQGNGWCTGTRGLILIGNSSVHIDLHSLSGITKIEVDACDNNGGMNMEVYNGADVIETVYPTGGIVFNNNQNEEITKIQLSSAEGVFTQVRIWYEHDAKDTPEMVNIPFDVVPPGVDPTDPYSEVTCNESWEENDMTMSLETNPGDNCYHTYSDGAFLLAGYPTGLNLDLSELQGVSYIEVEINSACGGYGCMFLDLYLGNTLVQSISDIDENNGDAILSFNNLQNLQFDEILVTGYEGFLGNIKVWYESSGTPTLNTSLTGENITCSNTSTDLQVTVTGGLPPYTYAWNDNSLSGPTPTVDSPGQYTVVVTDNSGATQTQSITIEDENFELAATVIQNVRCFGGDDGSATISVDGDDVNNYTILWDNGETTPTALTLDAGTHAVTLTNSFDCALVEQVTLTQGGAMNMSTEMTSPNYTGVEDNGEAIINHAFLSPPYTYQWSNGATTRTADGLALGTYYATLTDGNGCSESASVEIQEVFPLELDIAIDTPIICDGQTATISAVITGGYPDVTLEWGTGETTNTLNNLSEGTYSVTATDAFGAIAESTILLNTSTPEPISLFSLNVDNFEVSTTNLSLNADYYGWTFGGGASSSDFEPTHTFDQAGTYTICLVASNDCESKTYCQDIVVEDLPQPNENVVFMVDSIEGYFGDIIQVPVRARNFNDISSFQFSVHTSDVLNAEIIGVDNFNLPHLTIENFYLASTEYISCSWFNLDLDGITVAEDDILFVLTISLVGEEDTCVDIHINDTPTPIQVSTIENGLPVDVAYQTESGKACILATANIEGQIVREDGSPVSDVTVHCTDHDPVMTNMAGEYTIEKLHLLNDYTIRPEKTSDASAGVTVIDMLKINQHILSSVALDSPYKIIAADVDGSGTISGIDLLLVRQMILGLITEFPVTNSWKFVSEAYTFEDASNPLNEDFSEEIDFENLTTDQIEQNFIAIKIGDVTIDPINATASQVRSTEVLEFITKDQQFSFGEEVVIELKANDFNNIEAYQFELAFDKTNLEFDRITLGTLSNTSLNDFGLNRIEDGIITALWMNKNNTDTRNNEDAIIAKIHFRAESAGTLSNVLKLGNKVLENMAVNTTSEEFAIQLNFESTTPNTIVHSLTTNVFPNPTAEKLNVEVELKEPSTITISIVDLTGKVVGIITNTTTKYNGVQQFNTSVKELPSGNYFITVKTKNQVISKQFVKI